MRPRLLGSVLAAVFSIAAVLGVHGGSVLDAGQTRSVVLPDSGGNTVARVVPAGDSGWNGVAMAVPAGDSGWNGALSDGGWRALLTDADV